MSATDWLMENLALVVAVVVFVIFTIGLVLALRTAGGRDKLAGAAVRLAVAFLGLAERWLGEQLEQQALDGGVTLHQQSEVLLARVRLTAWMQRRRGGA